MEVAQPSSDNRPLEPIGNDDRPSVTDVNGTVARFDMAYSPDKRHRYAFGPTILAMLPSLAFLAFGIGVVGAVLTAYYGPSNTKLYTWIVEGDRNRPIGSGPLSVIIVLSALATVVRARLCGVVVTPDGIEARDLLALGVPRVRRWGWAQIDRVIVDKSGVMLELWSGTYEKLPTVREGSKLAELLAAIAMSRDKQVTRLE